MAGLGTEPGFEHLKSELARNRRVLDSELARNGGHWNRNWSGIGLGGIGYSPAIFHISRIYATKQDIYRYKGSSLHYWYVVVTGSNRKWPQNVSKRRDQGTFFN